MSYGAWANYNNAAGFDSIFGKLYNWHAVSTGKICPDGWIFPTFHAWDLLLQHFEAIGEFPGPEGNINAYSSGGIVSGNFKDIGTTGYFWSDISSIIENEAFLFKLIGKDLTNPRMLKCNGFSIRYVTF